MTIDGIANLSLLQALSIWSELEQAYYGDNGYGSDTAEIYAYRLQSHSPLLGKDEWESAARQEVERKAERAARTALAELCYLFMRERRVNITIDGKPVHLWTSSHSFDHRAHVRVVRLDEAP